MIKFAKVINDVTKQCDIGLGNDFDFYRSIGMQQLDVEQAYNGHWYLAGYCPEKSLEEQLRELETQYCMPRVIREGILGNPSAYSEFNVNRAKDLEDIAEKIRGSKEGSK